METTTRPNRFLQRYVVQVLTAPCRFFVDVVGTWPGVTGPKEEQVNKRVAGFWCYKNHTRTNIIAEENILCVSPVCQLIVGYISLPISAPKIEYSNTIDQLPIILSTLQPSSPCVHCWSLYAVMCTRYFLKIPLWNICIQHTLKALL